MISLPRPYANLNMSKDASREQVAFDKYTQLLVPRSSDDIFDPNIRKLDSKYTGRLNELYNSYLKAVHDVFKKRSTQDVPVLDIYLDFFTGFNKTDISYGQNLNKKADERVYGSVTDRDMKANRYLTLYAQRRLQYSQSKLTDDELCDMYEGVVKEMGYTLAEDSLQTNTNIRDCVVILRNDRSGTIKVWNGTSVNPLGFSCYGRYMNISMGLRELLANIETLKESIHNKYSEISVEYEAEKVKVIAEEDPVQGKKQMSETDSRFLEIMDQMGASEAAKMMFYGGDETAFP